MGRKGGKKKKEKKSQPTRIAPEEKETKDDHSILNYKSNQFSLNK
jgi:hypothetical protein